MRRESIRVFAKVAGTATPRASSRCFASVRVALLASGHAPPYALTPIRVDVIAGQVHRCIAPAEGGYTESDDKPLGKVHGNTDRTDRGHVEAQENPQNRRSRSFDPRSILTVAVGKAAFAGDECRQHRPQNIPQIAVFRTVRSMRAVFYRTLQQKIVLLAAPDPLTSTMALQSRLKRR